MGKPDEITLVSWASTQHPKYLTELLEKFFHDFHPKSFPGSISGASAMFFCLLHFFLNLENFSLLHNLLYWQWAKLEYADWRLCPRFSSSVDEETWEVRMFSRSRTRPVATTWWTHPKRARNKRAKYKVKDEVRKIYNLFSVRLSPWWFHVISSLQFTSRKIIKPT